MVQLPEISVTVDADRTSSDTTRRTYTLLPQINLAAQTEVAVESHEADDLFDLDILLQRPDVSGFEAREKLDATDTTSREKTATSHEETQRAKRNVTKPPAARRRASMAATEGTRVVQNSTTRKRLSLDL